MFLDTTFCIDLMREQHRGERGPATRKLESLGETPLYLPLFTVCELHAGARLSAAPDREIAKVERLTELVRVVSPDKTFAVSYGEAEAALRKEGIPIPTMDLLIGVLAKMHGSPLVTSDDRHFRLVPGLVIETY